MYSTFEQYIIGLFRKGDFESPEFKTALEVWGRPRLVEIWNKYKQSKIPLTQEFPNQENKSIQQAIDELFDSHDEDK